GDAAAGRPELVPAEVAGVAPEGERGRARARRRAAAGGRRTGVGRGPRPITPRFRRDGMGGSLGPLHPLRRPALRAETAYPAVDPSLACTPWLRSSRSASRAIHVALLELSSSKRSAAAIAAALRARFRFPI